MVCYHYHRKRIYYQRIPSDRSRERCCDRGKLLGQIQDGFPDDHDHFTADQSGGVFDILEQIFIWLSLALTVISLITYIWQNRSVLSMQD